MGHAQNDDDGNDYYDYYNEIVGKGVDFSKEGEEESEVRKGGIVGQWYSHESSFLNVDPTST